MLLRKINMSITLMRGGEVNYLATTGGSETKGLATPGGVVSPSIRQKRLLSKLTIKSINPKRYGKKTTFH